LAPAPWRLATWRELRDFRRLIAARRYDIVLDTQGLLKSALIARQAQGRHCGYAAEAAREPLAARFYDADLRHSAQCACGTTQPLAGRRRFRLPGRPAARLRDFGADDRNRWLGADRLVVLLTATSRDDKLWDERHWCELGQALLERGLTPVLPAGNALERQRAERIAAAVTAAVWRRR
jgi:heptosyltransferase-1